ncbi:serine kinase/phosphatase (plasmid) [Ralstonia pseudosolanacearum]|uniref:Serine kinase/phosphatase n=1 Tax=Ralstonia solanacearum TaxID=305 RepID=A0AA92QCW2_RALSL|nr:serine kinase/phosphatase [Ralstonia pseudosolanacearum]QOK98506.1 serine kinase/phosphatase [Ralstonia pseudosolanacearum]
MTIRGSLRFPQYPADLSAIADATGRTGFQVQMQAITHEGADEMLFAAELQNEDNRTNVFAKLMETGPKAAKDLLS